MNENTTRQFAARIRNIFQTGKFAARNNDGTVRIETVYGRVIDNLNEAFPYGFKTKSEQGAVTVFCAGGSLDAVKILPVEDCEFTPELEDGDVAVYSAGGNSAIFRKDGNVEVLSQEGNVSVTAQKGSVSITAGSGKKIYVGNGSESVASLLCALADDVLAKLQTFGAPPMHNVHPSTVAAVNAWKAKVQTAFSESAED